MSWLDNLFGALDAVFADSSSAGVCDAGIPSMDFSDPFASSTAVDIVPMQQLEWHNAFGTQADYQVPAESFQSHSWSDPFET